MGLAAVTGMVGPRNLIMYVPFAIHGLLLASEISISSQPVVGPLSFLPKIGFIQNQFKARLGTREIRMKLFHARNDLEVYIGFYLIAVFFIGWSHFIAIALYWQ